MAINFPSNPANNDVYSYGNQTWYWANNYGVWQANTNSGYTGSLGYTGSIGYVGSQGPAGGYTGSSGALLNINSFEQEVTTDSPYLWYKFNETSGNVINYGSYAPAGNLTLGGVYTQAFGQVLPANATSNGILFSGTTASANAGTSVGLSAPITGDWTWECVLIPFLNGTNPIYIANFGATGETLATNYQFSVRITAAGAINTFWEYGSGTDELTTTNAYVVNGVPNHVVVVKDSTAKTITTYINGLKASLSTYVNEPAGGTSDTFAVNYGVAADAQSPNLRSHTIYYSGTKLSDSRVLAHAKSTGIYQAGYIYTQNVTGYTGSAGINGYAGSRGDTGFVGSVGYVGSAGSSGSGASVSVSSSAPGTPSNGDLWWNSDTGKLYIYYNDGSSAQWTVASPISTGYTGSTGNMDIGIAYAMRTITF